MTDFILLFTFSPIQPFIIEARRTADLHTGSAILVELAKAAAQSIEAQGGELIYPAGGKDGRLPDDVPNKIVAKIKSGDGAQIAKDAGAALLEKWSGKSASIAEDAKKEFLSKSSKVDNEWESIWKRQTAADYLWEVYWVVVDLPSDDKYHDTYLDAEKSLAAVKRTRMFHQPLGGEPGLKDSLSGRRQALHIKEKNAKAYWKDESEKNPSKVKAGERLDAVGLIKRFSPLDAETQQRLSPFNGFPSTSSIASADFLARAKQSQNASLLMPYKDSLAQITQSQNAFWPVRKDDDWPHDGDLLYLETLTKKKLKDDYNIDSTDEILKAKDGPLNKLKALHKQVGKPSLYYAILAFDGDNMGVRVTGCKNEGEHRDLSDALTKFAMSVPEIAKNHKAAVVYNGGDDILAMAPLSTAFDFARELAQAFEKTGNKASASCGIAIAHHTSPLGVALREARKAESKAKKLPDKAAVCVTVLKRSGEIKDMRSRWDQENPSPGGEPILGQLIKYMRDDQDILSSRFAYEVAREANTTAALLPEARKALLARQVKRHVNRNDKLEMLVSAEESLTDIQIKKRVDEWIDKLTNTLHQWSVEMDKQLPPLNNVPQGMVELGRWLIFARFVAQGGGE